MDQWTKVIAASVSPIIVISACGLLCLAFYNRMAAIVNRLRTASCRRLHPIRRNSIEPNTPSFFSRRGNREH